VELAYQPTNEKFFSLLNITFSPSIISIESHVRLSRHIVLLI